MEAHSAGVGDVRVAVQAPPWAGLVVIAATAAVVAPMTVTASWTWHLTAAILLIALTAAAVTGFPSGWVGMLMAAAWGLALGILRLRTRGIVVPYLVHVTANAVIGSLAVILL